MKKPANAHKHPSVKPHRRHMSDSDIRKILALIDNWQGVLRWDLLIEEIQKQTGRAWTRQALANHERIRIAFQVRKRLDQKESNKSPRGHVGIQAVEERIRKMEITIARLEAENNRLLVQFFRWAHNAHKRGLDESALNAPLPSIDREATRLEPRPGRRGNSRSSNRE